MDAGHVALLCLAVIGWAAAGVFLAYCARLERHWLEQITQTQVERNAGIEKERRMALAQVARAKAEERLAKRNEWLANIREQLEGIVEWIKTDDKE